MRNQSNKDIVTLLSSFEEKRGEHQPFKRRQQPVAVDQPILAAVGKPAVVKSLHRTSVHIGVFSPSGGSGKSTITAGIGSMLCQQGKHVLLIDTSPWQSLAFHFGATEARSGRRTFFAPGARETAIHLLCCDEDAASYPDSDEFMVAHSVDYVLYDLGGLSGDRLIAHIRDCDSLLVPVLPDSSAIRSVAIVQKMLRSLGSAAPRVQFLLNNMDDSAAAKEVRDDLAQSLGEQLFPSAILHQPEVRMALADGVVLPFYAPQAQATTVFGEITQWLVSPEKGLTVTQGRWSEG